ncbi:MAG TPA: flavin reductase family protein [Candidatus Polarisedimenticolia bacterium]|nr:flavin reductase family protein [Candidatus Polarisedimenticolia bacterium]
MTRRKAETKVEISTDKSRWSPALIPGPLVLITSLSSRGEPHAARKSWLTVVSSSPPMLALSCSLSHRTAINILETREFVVNVPGAELAVKAWAAADAVEPETPAPAWSFAGSSRVAAPRLQECRGHLECVLDSVKRIGEQDVVFFARIVAASLDESIVRAQPEERYRLLRSIVFLERDLYGVIEAVRRTPAGR